MTTTTYADARANFDVLWDTAINDREPIRIQRQGAEDVVLISADDLESLQARSRNGQFSSIDNQRLTSALNRALNEPDATAPQTLEEVRREFHLHESQ